MTPPQQISYRLDMRQADWRKKNGLSLRACASLFGLQSPNAVLNLEHGGRPFAELADRIYFVTKMIGPEPVTYHSEHRIRAEARAAVSAYKRAQSKKGKPRGNT